jgi:hypothetical protein
MSTSKREWNTPVREPWNPVIQHLLKGIDNHIQCNLGTGDVWHLQKAEELRAYVTELKDWIMKEEGKV